MTGSLMPLTIRQGSLVEVLPEDLPVIESFDPVAAASVAKGLLDDPAAGQKVVDSILAKGTEFSWARVAGEVVEVFDEVTSRPASRVVAIRGEQGYAHLSDVGIGGGSGSPLKRGMDFAVDWFLARPDLRTKLVPPNSARQAFARRAIDEVHRRF